MLIFKPLLAADWIEFAIFLVIIVTSLVGQVLKAAKKHRQKAQRQAPDLRTRPKPGRPPPPQAQPVAGGGERVKGSLEVEIEDFLRKNLRGDARGEHDRPTAPVRPRQTASTPQAQRSPARPPGGPQRQRQRPPASQADQPYPQGQTVSQHTQQHIASSNVGEHAEGLAGSIRQADERLESHLRDVFDHQLGTLKRTDERGGGSIRQGTDSSVWSQGRQANPLADQIYAMLSSPADVRAAIVLSEILRRPDDRWS